MTVAVREVEPETCPTCERKLPPGETMRFYTCDRCGHAGEGEPPYSLQDDREGSYGTPAAFDACSPDCYRVLLTAWLAREET